MLESMSVAERVGQLFLITFRGDRATLDSEIAELILTYQIGNVVLLSENDNITGYGDPAAVQRQLAELSNDLQRLALLEYTTAGDEPPDSDPNRALIPPTPIPLPRSAVVPLFIATSHGGDSLPVGNVMTGFTELPNYMSIGATWQPEFARDVGKIAGQELAAAGVNMLLGPALDVLENPTPLNPGDLGTNTFGGDPYWVGLMGQAYIEGIHTGSDNRIAVVATSFPGKGSSDRPVHEEVPTVRKSLEQLKQIELAPFITVTGQPVGNTATADALLATHIRYQGFQGNIRATTAPVSFDPQALNTLMALPEFTTWRQSGGLIVSDALGVRSVERLFDDTEQEFPHRQVAKDALLAGNDLLYLSNFALGDNDPAAEVANIRDTIVWFREKYNTDPTFMARVNEAVARILELKLRLYEGDFSAGNVLVDPEATAEPTSTTPPDTAALTDLAQAAVTLLSPSPAELVERLSSPPGLQDNLVIFTDVRQIQQCSACGPQPLLSATALAERIIALYGPDGSGQIRPEQINSFTFNDLQAFLNAGPGPIPPPAETETPPTQTSEPPSTLITETPEEGSEPPQEPELTATPVPTTTISAAYQVQQSLSGADVLIFAMLNANGRAVNGSTVNDGSQALTNILEQRPDLIRNRQVIVFAYDAPYHLDTTEISKLTAFFGVYSKTDAFIDASVRALFVESPLSGASPVNVPGVRYNLFEQTQPDLQQVIELFFVFDGSVQSPPSQQPVNAEIGDTLHLQTGVIRDRNGNPVPDGTLVRFIQHDRIQGTVTVIADRPTTGGIAQLDYVLEARTGPGQFRITAESGAATSSQEVDIAIEDDAQLAIITPTPGPTTTATPTDTPDPTIAPTETFVPSTPMATPPAAASTISEDGLELIMEDFRMFLSVLVGLTAVALLVLALNRRQAVPLVQRIGWLLWGFAGGLLFYNYFALGLPGTASLNGTGALAGLLTTLVGGIAGLLLYRWLPTLHKG
jgi:beta-N-acetylhexosaminidase